MGCAWLKADGTEERTKEDVSRAWHKAIMLIVAFDTGQVNFGKHFVKCFTQKGKGRVVVVVKTVFRRKLESRYEL